MLKGSLKGINSMARASVNLLFYVSPKYHKYDYMIDGWGEWVRFANLSCLLES